MAKKLFGEKLAIASLAAVQKGTRPDGSVEIRIVQDGTHGININSSIEVLNHVAHPAANDVQRILQECMDSGVPHYAAVANVREAHRQIHVDPQDAPLQSCQLEPGGPLFVCMVATFGVASALFWWGRLGFRLLRLLLRIVGRKAFAVDTLVRR